MRILLFLATNLAVILVASVTLSLLGVDSYLAQNGINYGSLLAFAAVFGFAEGCVAPVLAGLVVGCEVGAAVGCDVGWDEGAIWVSPPALTLAARTA